MSWQQYRDALRKLRYTNPAGSWLPFLRGVVGLLRHARYLFTHNTPNKGV